MELQIIDIVFYVVLGLSLLCLSVAFADYVKDRISRWLFLRQFKEEKGNHE